MSPTRSAVIGRNEAIANPALPVIRDGSLQFDAQINLPASVSGRAAVLVPTENVLLVAASLPLSSQRQRMEAAPYAIEGMLAEPLAVTHVALGPEIGPKSYLLGAVRSDVLAGWMTLISKSGFSEARLVPDVMLVPRPKAGFWGVSTNGARTLVRRGDGSGFAIETSMLAAAWRIAGSPAMAVWGDALPQDLAAHGSAGSALDREAADHIAGVFDLREGGFSGSRMRKSGFLHRAALLAGVGATLLTLLWVADTVALARLAHQREATARALLRDILPGLPPDANIADQLSLLIPDTNSVRHSRFLPLLSEVAEALSSQSEPVSLQNLAYNATDRQLALEVTAENLAGLQRIQAMIGGAGFKADSGVATAENGGAQVRIIVHDTAVP